MNKTQDHCRQMYLNTILPWYSSYWRRYQ